MGGVVGHELRVAVRPSTAVWVVWATQVEPKVRCWGREVPAGGLDRVLRGRWLLWVMAAVGDGPVESVPAPRGLTRGRGPAAGGGGSGASGRSPGVFVAVWTSAGGRFRRRSTGGRRPWIGRAGTGEGARRRTV